MACVARYEPRYYTRFIIGNRNTKQVSLRFLISSHGLIPFVSIEGSVQFSGNAGAHLFD